MREVVQEKKIEATIEKITDRNRFLDFGVMWTPGLVVNGKVLSSGKIPTKHTLEHWLEDVAKEAEK